MIKPLLVVGMLLTMFADHASAAGSDWSGGSRSDADMDDAVVAIESGRYEDAIPALRRVLAREPRSADAYNYLGYSHRKLGQLEDALRHYIQALGIDPEHRGANEYLGELYLEMGDLAKAEERLAVLDEACFFGCAEHRDLKAAIEAHKASQ